MKKFILIAVLFVSAFSFANNEPKVEDEAPSLTRIELFLTRNGRRTTQTVTIDNSTVYVYEKTNGRKFIVYPNKKARGGYSKKFI